MYSSVKLYSNTDGEIFRFLSKYFTSSNTSQKQDFTADILEWERIYQNPVEIATILGVYVDNIDKFDIKMWISLDKGYFIKITSNNADNIIRYLYERYPY